MSLGRYFLGGDGAWGKSIAGQASKGGIQCLTFKIFQLIELKKANL